MCRRAWEVWYKMHNEEPPRFTARIITHKIIKTAVKTYAHLHALREKAEEAKGCVYVCVLAHDHPSNRTVPEGDRLFDGWLSRTASGVVWLGRRETSGGLPRGSQTTIILQSRGNTPKDVFILGDIRWKWRICPSDGNSHRNIKTHISRSKITKKV